MWWIFLVAALGRDAKRASSACGGFLTGCEARIFSLRGVPGESLESEKRRFSRAAATCGQRPTIRLPHRQAGANSRDSPNQVLWPKLRCMEQKDKDTTTTQVARTHPEELLQGIYSEAGPSRPAPPRPAWPATRTGGPHRRSPTSR